MTDYKELENKIFEILCINEASALNMGAPIPSTFIRDTLKITLYKVRKVLKALKDKGLIESHFTSFYSSWYEQFFISNGYRLTEKGKQTDEYKKAEERENYYWNELCKKEY